VRTSPKDSSNYLIFLEKSVVNMPFRFQIKENPFGKGFGNNDHENMTRSLSNLIREQSSIILLQYMREDQLSGIEAVGFVKIFEIIWKASDLEWLFKTNS